MGKIRGAEKDQRNNKLKGEGGNERGERKQRRKRGEGGNERTKGRGW